MAPLRRQQRVAVLETLGFEVLVGRRLYAEASTVLALERPGLPLAGQRLQLVVTGKGARPREEAPRRYG